MDIVIAETKYDLSETDNTGLVTHICWTGAKSVICPTFCCSRCKKDKAIHFSAAHWRSELCSGSQLTGSAVYLERYGSICHKFFLLNLYHCLYTWEKLSCRHLSSVCIPPVIVVSICLIQFTRWTDLELNTEFSKEAFDINYYLKRTWFWKLWWQQCSAKSKIWWPVCGAADWVAIAAEESDRRFDERESQRPCMRC